MRKAIEKAIERGLFQEKISSKYCSFYNVQPYPTYTCNVIEEKKHYEIKLYRELTEKDKYCSSCGSSSVRNERDYCLNVCKKQKDYNYSIDAYNEGKKYHKYYTYKYTLADLIFSTDCIDKLVGDRDGYDKMLTKMHLRDLSTMTTEQRVEYINNLAEV